MYRVPLAVNTWGLLEKQAIDDVFASGRFTMGARVARFEAEFAQYVNAEHAIMVNSGSSALLLAAYAVHAGYLVLGRTKLPNRPYVRVPAVTWPTTIWPFMQVGIDIQLVDVNPETLVAAEPVHVPVHLMGNRCPEHGEKDGLVEDGCEWMGPLSADIGCYSFFFSHHMSTGEGGMVVTNNERTADRLRSLRAHGWIRNSSETYRMSAEMDARDIDPRFLFADWGFNVKPTEFQAAIGSVQLQRLPGFNEQRKWAWRQMKDDLPHGLKTMRPTTPDIVPFAFPIMSPDKATRKALSAHLEAAGIETRPIAGGNLARQPAMEKHKDKWTAGELPGADYVHDCAIFIGLWPGMTREHTDHMLETLRRFGG